MNFLSKDPAASSRDSIAVHEASWPTIIAFVAAAAGVVTLLSAGNRIPLLAPLLAPLAGGSWLSNAVTFGTLDIVTIGGVLVVAGGMRPADLGLSLRRYPAGVAVTLAVWVGIQVVAALSIGHVVLAPTWTQAGPGHVLRWAAVMFAGTALYEEIAFRAFLFPQLALKLRGAGRSGTWIAALVSQLVFSAYHFPTNILHGHLSGAALWMEFTIQALLGLVLLLLYLRTRNLWVAVGLHGLADAPTQLFSGATSLEIFALVVLVAWPWLARDPAAHGLARIESLGPSREQAIGSDPAPALA